MGQPGLLALNGNLLWVVFQNSCALAVGDMWLNQALLFDLFIIDR